MQVVTSNPVVASQPLAAPAAGGADPRHAAVLTELHKVIPAARLVTDPLRRLAYGTDASFYRLVPQVVVIADTEDEVIAVLAACRRHGTSVTFRAAGTSLAGQAISDSVLLTLSERWRGHTLSPDALRIRLQAGVIGAEANRILAPHRRKIGPDPASIGAAKMGGIAANNASGMCCGTAQNSYQTLAGMRLVLVDGTVLDTEDAASVAAFRVSHAALLDGLAALARQVGDDAALTARIRHKYRLKNTTGYGLNALVDYADPVEILTHLLIGSEGTLAFISSITLLTVVEARHKASALLLFDDLEAACETVALLKPTPVAAVELFDRPALRSVQGEPEMPAAARALGAGGAALLVETRADDAGTLAAQIAAIGGVLQGARLAQPAVFSTDVAVCAGLWKLRKGMFPAVGAMRRAGTTVVIEDVAFPVPRLAAATLDLQALLAANGYPEAIIFGHALEGNLHFVFTQDFNDPAEVARYARFMDAVCDLVVERYDGSLKAEHGTGRNVAPFVAREWGPDAYALMERIKGLFDPAGLLNPGVILNDDPQSHLRHLKPMPAAHPIVDACIECGFCEPLCPSAGFTATPRQRIVGLREIHRLEAAGDGGAAAAMRNAYDHFAIDTCATCGLCATACPIHIETGLLTKQLRAQRHGPMAQGVARFAANHFGGVTTLVKAGLGAVDLAHGVLGTTVLKGAADLAERTLGTPRWSASMPRPARRSGGAATRAGGPAGSAVEPIVYFPSCATRTMGPARGEPVSESVQDVAARVFRRAGYAPRVPDDAARLCCGQPFESLGLLESADAKAAELEAALRVASDGGRLPIVFDTSPCAYRMKKFVDGRLAILDVTEFLHDRVLPRLAPQPVAATVALHAVCSVRKRGLDGKLGAIARACATTVIEPPGVQCCGFAGSMGFIAPELNDHALRHLPAALPAGCRTGYATSRTCEIGLAAHAGIPYRSILYLVDEATAAGAAATPSTTAAAGTVTVAD